MATLLDFPLPICTPRLQIHPMQPGDGKEVFAAIQETKEQLTQWLTWPHKVHQWEDCEIAARQFYAQFVLRKEFHFLIWQEGQLVGGCSLHRVNWNIPAAEIGYWCRTSCQGRGYIREAIEGLTKHAFEQMGLKRLTILCDAENHKSCAIPEAIGYQLEVETKGLVCKPGSDTLRLGRCYSRFYEPSMG